MFKNNHFRLLKPCARGDETMRAPRLLPCVFFVFIICVAGCQIFPKLPPVDLSQPGWNVRQGQAVWRSKKDAPEIAGELVVATNPDGDSFVQFTKTPLPFFTAQSTKKSWQVHAIPENKTYSGRGNPPARVPWLWIPRCLAGQTPPKTLAWQTLTNGNWRIENRKTGESLEGYLSP